MPGGAGQNQIGRGEGVRGEGGEGRGGGGGEGGGAKIALEIYLLSTIQLIVFSISLHACLICTCIHNYNYNNIHVYMNRCSHCI